MCVCVSPRVDTDLLQKHDVCIYVKVCVDVCLCMSVFVWKSHDFRVNLKYSDVQQRASLNQGEICREIEVILYIVSWGWGMGKRHDLIKNKT